MKIQCSYCDKWIPKTVRSQILDGKCSITQEWKKGTFLCSEFELIKTERLENEESNNKQESNS